MAEAAVLIVILKASITVLSQDPQPKPHQAALGLGKHFITITEAQ